MYSIDNPPGLRAFLLGAIAIIILPHVNGIEPTYLKCQSYDNKFQRCGYYGGYITSSSLKKEIGGDCSQHLAYGYDSESVWVDKGCKAVFRLQVKKEDEIRPPFRPKSTCSPVKKPCCERGRLNVDLSPISPSHTYGSETLQCGTYADGCARCPLDALLANGTLYSADIQQELSAAGTCNLDGAWGFDRQAVWVDKGCRAIFLLLVKYKDSDYKTYYGDLKGVTVDTLDEPPVDGRQVRLQGCDQRALITADFERLTPTRKGCRYGCLEGPACGRRMLKIKLTLSNTDRRGYVFNIGDSETNDGFGRDNSTQENDAEAYCEYPNLLVYGSNKCDTETIVEIVDGCGPGVHTLTIYISNQYIRILNNLGLDYRRCRKCLFALDGQSDNMGPRNERVYIGLNRVVNPNRLNERPGSGVCLATLSWACPWCDGQSDGPTYEVVL